jgi:hypothetical protein
VSKGYFSARDHFKKDILALNETSMAKLELMGKRVFVEKTVFDSERALR